MTKNFNFGKTLVTMCVIMGLSTSSIAAQTTGDCSSRTKLERTKIGKTEKNVIAAGVTTTAAGTAAAVGGEAALWAVFSAGSGAALTGAAETSAFLAWLGGGSLAAGGGGMAVGSTVLAAIGPIGWTIAGIGMAATVVTICVSNGKKDAVSEK